MRMCIYKAFDVGMLPLLERATSMVAHYLGKVQPSSRLADSDVVDLDRVNDFAWVKNILKNGKDTFSASQILIKSLKV